MAILNKLPMDVRENDLWFIVAVLSSSKTTTKRNLCHILKALVLHHSVKHTYIGIQIMYENKHKNILFNIVILHFLLLQPNWVFWPQNLGDHRTFSMSRHGGFHVASMPLSHPMRDSRKWWTWALVMIFSVIYTIVEHYKLDT